MEFEAAGERAAATKLTLCVCLSNLSISLVQFLDGVTHDRFGITGMLLREAAFGIVSAVLLRAMVVATRRLLWLRQTEQPVP